MRRFVILLIMFFYALCSFAENNHEKMVEKYKSRWVSLMPRQAKMQFAGSMGFLSAGPGWFYGKKNQWETDMYIGFIPNINNSEGHTTMTIKQTYTPFSVCVNDRLRFVPLTSGIYLNKISGEYFWSRLPERYPKNYYFWAVNTRFHIFLGQAFSFQLTEKTLGKELSFFYEFNTNDLYVISAIGNKSIGLKDIVSLSFGIRYRVF